MKAPQETAYEFVADSVNSSKEMSKESTIFKHTEADFEDQNDFIFDPFFED